MSKRKSIHLNRNVYIIIAGILLLAGAVQITNSEYILQFNRNDEMSEAAKSWRPDTDDQAAMMRTGSPYCLAYDSSDPEQFYKKVNDNISRVLTYMKLPVLESETGSLQTDGCAAVILTSPKLGAVNHADLAGYVENGGYVFITVPPDTDDAFFRLYRKMGIRTVGSYVTEQSIELTSNVLIGERGLTIDESFVTNASLLVELETDSRLLARTKSGVPLLWDHDYGKGKFMVFNGLMLSEKINRGIIAGAVSMLEPDFIYPIFNTKIMYIDDFPAPIARTIDPQIYREYKRDRVRFFKEIWWPDMLKAANNHDVEYTAVLIQSYDDQVSPPFEDPIDEDLEGLISYGREVIKSGGEIGLHGFNHQSLVTDQQVAGAFGYRPWKSADHMARSIAETVDFAKRAFPGYRMVSYVPPSNVLSPEGRAALKRAWPDMAIIASLYPEDESGHSYVQEYEIAADGILELPRITSGYFERPFDRWAEANTMTSLGIISHFIHPDDVINDERSGNKSWDDLYKEYSKLLSRWDKTYPWLRPLTSIEAGMAVERMISSAVEWHREDGKIAGTITPFKGEAYYIMRTDKRITSTLGCSTRLIDEDTYLVTAHKANFEIRTGG